MRFRYCECGCHCFEASAGELHFTVFDNLKGKVTLYKGHGRTMGFKLGEFESLKEADQEATKIAKAGLRQMAKDLDES
jgi:hypothetical protein